MWKRPGSIRTKILVDTLVLLLFLSIVLGFSSVHIVQRLARTDSEQIMNQLCESESLRFDNKLSMVQHSVKMIYEYATEQKANSGLDVLSDSYEHRVKDFAISVANDTEGAMAVYFRYNPKLVGDGTSGFFWSRKQDSNVFTEEPPTDILAYNATDVEHVGWFYMPIQTGAPLWMTPYYNKNLDVFMISYIMPFYDDSGECVGVIGMDIDFNSILSAASNVKIYNTGHLALVDKAERIIYYCSENGNASGQRISQKLYNHLTTINKESELLEITEPDGTISVSCTNSLSNGMLLYISVPKDEINENRNNLILILTSITIVICIVTALILLKNTSVLIQPIKDLVDVANNYAKGNWDQNYICNSGDELQELSESIAIMSNQTRDYIKRLNNLARTDAMTGVRNKTSYLEFVEELCENRHNKYSEYAICFMDLNFLKSTNDAYGHEAGDILLKEATKYICKTFKTSAVFRVGGDEFVTILLNEDYKNREQLVKQFEKGMGYNVPGIDGVKLSISYGLADYHENQNNYNELYRLADERMYEHKQMMHR